jgi:hypothetical protein
MSDVDRVSSSGLYPALPIADRQRDRRQPSGESPSDTHGRAPQSGTHDPSDAAEPRPPRSLIDEYA